MPGPTPAPSPNAAPKTFREAIVDASAAGPVAAPKTANAKDPAVYLGQRENPSLMGSSGYYSSLGAGGKRQTIDDAVPLSEVAAQYHRWDQKTHDKFLTQLSLAGYDTDKMRDNDVFEMWANYSAQAAAKYMAGVKLTPWDMLAKDRKQRESVVVAPRTVTQTATNLDISSALTARAIFQEATKALLGRAPTKAETRSFQSRLNAYEKANPQTTTTTTSYAGGLMGAVGTGDVTGQSSTTRGGVQAADRAMIAEDAAKTDPEYGAYQAATSGMNWLMEMVNGG